MLKDGTQLVDVMLLIFILTVTIALVGKAADAIGAELGGHYFIGALILCAIFWLMGFVWFGPRLFKKMRKRVS